MVKKPPVKILDDFLSPGKLIKDYYTTITKAKIRRHYRNM